MQVQWDSDMTVQEMVDEGTRRAYTNPDNPLRASVLADPAGSPGPAVRNHVVSSTALDSFLDKWRSRWPEWSVAAPFVAEPQRDIAVAWFALLQEFDDMLNTSG
ncbi:hypothetical protein ACWTQY_30775, partial [Klebsiella pneumoniae]